MRVIKRRCSVCGRTIEVKVHDDGTYEGGHYFGNLASAMKELGMYDPNVADEEYEYWECLECAEGVHLEAEREKTMFGANPRLSSFREEDRLKGR